MSILYINICSLYTQIYVHIIRQHMPIYGYIVYYNNAIYLRVDAKLFRQDNISIRICFTIINKTSDK